MKWVTAAWLIVRDILLTGTGLFLIFQQAYSRHPSDVLLAVALALATPAVAEHVKALLSGPGGGSSSPSPPPASSSPSSSPPEAPGE